MFLSPLRGFLFMPTKPPGLAPWAIHFRPYGTVGAPDAVTHRQVTHLITDRLNNAGRITTDDEGRRQFHRYGAGRVGKVMLGA